MKRIVITGATSMIGAALVEKCLEQDVEMYCVVRKDSPKLGRIPASSNVHLIDCDLEHIKDLPSLIQETCDTFYHIAWGNTGENRNKSTQLQSDNITYTLEAVKAAHKLGCRRFIGAGSQAEYGPLNLEKIGPDTPANPTTPYGAAKLAAGLLSKLLCKELGMEWIWPRIFSVYGIYEKETTMVASGLRKMLQGEPTEFTPAQQRWDYLYSKDAGLAYYLIGEKGKDGSVYCVGSGQARPLFAYIEDMARLTGAKETGIGKRPYPPNPVMNLCADTKNLCVDTGYEPKYTFERGIQETIEWIKTLRKTDGRK